MVADKILRGMLKLIADTCRRNRYFAYCFALPNTTPTRPPPKDIAVHTDKPSRAAALDFCCPRVWPGPWGSLLKNRR